MKGVKFRMAALASALLSACVSRESVYQQTIADYVQTDRHGTWTDLHFKVVSIEAENCTVADSIAILYEDSRKEQAIAIESEQRNLAYWRSQMEQFKHEPVDLKLKDKYWKNVVLSEFRLDSLENMKPVEPVCYQGMDANQVLAIYVTCRYGVNLPGNNAYQERTDRFILTPDGSTVLGKEERVAKK